MKNTIHEQKAICPYCGSNIYTEAYVYWNMYEYAIKCPFCENNVKVWVENNPIFHLEK